MIIKTTVNNLNNLFAEEKARVKFNRVNKIGNASNNNAQIKKCDFVQYLLDSLPDNVVLEIENCRGDNEIRDFALANAGSVVECIVKAHLDRARNGEYTKAWQDDDADAVNGCIAWEVKASLEAHYLATPAKGNKATLLINRDGVSLIKKADVQSIVNGRGRLPARGVYGSRDGFMVRFLEQALGLEGGIDEVEA